MIDKQHIGSSIVLFQTIIVDISKRNVQDIVSN